ncbi:MAG TPA: type I-MYXAN CRISPR-associated protein Cas6/Cmx6 [Gallionellaceae bacterium]|nr:type I-MYXAN CRISPR-associated protein Cas6/Cmx6 [Gallionellaceae bacterium]
MRISDAIPEMADIVFALSGRSLPEAYAFHLWCAVESVLPWLEAEEYAGILPLRTSASGEGALLPQRARLVLRVPVELLPQAQQMSGQMLDVGGHNLSVGTAKERPLQAHSTLHAHLVASAEPEENFLSSVAAELRGMGVMCKWICGKHMTIAGERPINGYSLVLHDLKPQDSLLMQFVGLGTERRYGCGIFVPYKFIPNLD